MPIFSIGRAQQLSKTNDNTDVPAQLSSSQNTLFSYAIVIGKPSARGTNAGEVWIGPTSGNNEQPYSIQPGDIIFIDLGNPKERRLDFYDWYLDVQNANDGVTIIYI